MIFLVFWVYPTYYDYYFAPMAFTLFPRAQSAAVDFVSTVL